MSDQPEGRHRWRWRRPSNDFLLSMAATLLSLCAVVTTVWQTSIMREQLRLSVWPRVRLDVRAMSENGEDFFGINLKNLGVGPGIIHDIRFSYRGRPVRGLADFWSQVMKENGLATVQLRSQEVTSVSPGEVLAPQESVVLLSCRGLKPSTGELFKKARPHLRIDVRYASIYGQAWRTGFPDLTARPDGWVETLP
jgi:hypothetical protein